MNVSKLIFHFILANRTTFYGLPTVLNPWIAGSQVSFSYMWNFDPRDDPYYQIGQYWTTDPLIVTTSGPDASGLIQVTTVLPQNLSTNTDYRIFIGVPGGILSKSSTFSVYKSGTVFATTAPYYSQQQIKTTSTCFSTPSTAIDPTASSQLNAQVTTSAIPAVYLYAGPDISHTVTMQNIQTATVPSYPLGYPQVATTCTSGIHPSNH